MRSFALSITCLGSFLVLAGCAAGLRAEANALPFALPSTPETVRLRILYTRHAVSLSCAGAYRFQMRESTKSFLRHSSTSVRAMRSAMVFGQTSFKGEVVVMPESSTD